MGPVAKACLMPAVEHAQARVMPRLILARSCREGSGAAIVAARDAALRDALDDLRGLLRSSEDSAFDSSAAALRPWRADTDDAALNARVGLDREVATVSEEARHFLIHPVALPRRRGDRHGGANCSVACLKLTPPRLLSSNVSSPSSRLGALPSRSQQVRTQTSSATDEAASGTLPPFAAARRRRLVAPTTHSTLGG
jgi:hypothetical protein